MSYEEEWQEIQRNRRQSAKKWLRYLPRRSTLAKYKIFKLFGEGFLKRRYLWSFDYKHVKPAFYAGWILTLLPVMGAQIFLGSVLAVLLRANIMILVALQMISNPLTVGVLWSFEYHVGKQCFKVLEKYNLREFKQTSNTVFEPNNKHPIEEGLRKGIKVTIAIVLGAIVLGYICALISCLIYKYFYDRTLPTYQHFLQKKQDMLKQTETKK